MDTTDSPARGCFVRLFGSPTIEHSGQPRRFSGSRKALALLAYLARHDHPVERGQLASLLWSETSDTRARRNLTRELAQLATLLPDCLQADFHAVQWAPRGAIQVDVTQAYTLLARSAPTTYPAGIASIAHLDPHVLAQVADRYCGDFLAGWYLDGCPEFESWLTGEREYWRRHMVAVWSALITYHTAQASYTVAEHYARRWTELEPWDEDGHYTLIKVLALSGKRSAALAQYLRCRRTLADELGVEPGAATVALYEQLRMGTMNVPPPQANAPAPPPLVARDRRHDWGNAPDIHPLYGRTEELATLERWLSDDQCRVVALLGMGGAGKTALAARLAQQLAPQYDVVIWRSLRNAPLLDDLLHTCLPWTIAQPDHELDGRHDAQCAQLLDLFRQQRCLLVLDNYESILHPAGRAGSYRPEYEAYGQLVRCLGECAHQSCLLLTSREQPHGFALLHAATASVRSFQVPGLSAAAGQHLLCAHGLTAMCDSGRQIVRRYSGNLLALNVVAATVNDLFCGDLDAFVSADALIFDDIRDVLDQQWGRLTRIEQDILLWLAIARAPLSMDRLRANLITTSGQQQILEALCSLQRRSLIEPHGTRLAVQHVVMEYLTDQFINQHDLREARKPALGACA